MENENASKSTPGRFLFRWRHSDDFGLTARGLYLLFRRLAETMGVDGQRFFQLALAQDHDRFERGFANHAAFEERFRSHTRPGVEDLLQIGQVNLGPFALEYVGEAALRQPAMQRHLTAFKTAHARIARARFLTFIAAPRGF